MAKNQFNQRQKLAILKSAEKLGVRGAAELAGIHYTTVYDWRNQHKVMGEKAFLEYKPAIPGRGIKHIAPEQEEAVLTTWHANPGFGPGQVRNQLRRQGITISIRSVRKIMEADGYKASGKKLKKEKSKRFEASRPLELAQMDILEFFINKLKIYLILLLDDFSRFILGWSLLESTSIDSVIELVDQSINRYGKMEEVLTDRGFVFYSWRGINRFEKFLEMYKIDHTHSRPHHPQTLGKVEACNKRIKRELIDQQHFANFHKAETAIGNWVEHYNYKRTHQGIGGLLVPAERFHGQSKQVLAAMEKSIDVTDHSCYTFTDIERSIINLVLSPDRKISLYILGQPIMLSGGINVETAECQ
ncbi:MAG: DDE-type integrase/transposase/recombinase [Thermodesulfobacteriota bacterium]|nr:DDE-type integrase/transposase/recombinase [Thermodesulfobacteriota bacterium]